MRKTTGDQKCKQLLTVGSWSAITRGATIYGLEKASVTSEPSTVRSRILRQSYGTLADTSYNSAIHDEQLDRGWDPLKQKFYAQRQTFWFLRRVSRHLSEIVLTHLTISKNQEVTIDHTESIDFVDMVNCANVEDNDIISLTAAIIMSDKEILPTRWEPGTLTSYSHSECLADEVDRYGGIDTTF